MPSVASKMMAAGNRAAAWVYRRTKGRIGGSAKGIPVLLITVPGRKTGVPRSVPVAFFEHSHDYLVAGSAGGGKADPQWIHNLAAAGKARINVYEMNTRSTLESSMVPSATNSGRRSSWPGLPSSQNTRRSRVGQSRSLY